jgi:hypothetical protein
VGFEKGLAVIQIWYANIVRSEKRKDDKKAFQDANVEASKKEGENRAKKAAERKAASDNIIPSSSSRS